MEFKSIKEYVKNIIASFPIDDFKNISIDYLDSELFSFSIETIPDIKVITKYVDGATLEQFKFMIISNRLYSNNDRIMLDNAGFFEVFSDWIENLKLIKPKELNINPIKFETLGHVFIHDNDSEKARYTQEIRLIYIKKRQIT